MTFSALDSSCPGCALGQTDTATTVWWIAAGAVVLGLFLLSRGGR